MRLKKTLAVAGASAVSMLFALTPAAQAQVQLENNSIVVESTVSVCGGPCIIMDVDGSDMLLGSGNGTGSGEDIDLEIRDAFATNFANDLSFLFNASAADLRMGSGSSTTAGDDGDLQIEDGNGTISFDIDGSSGNINQDVDNVTITNGNGAVKAWAKINGDGTVDSCWKCSTNTTQTQRLTTGQYEVDFTLGNIDQRPCLASSGSHSTGDQADRNVECYDSADPSSKNVETNDLAGADADGAFTVVIF